MHKTSRPLPLAVLGILASLALSACLRKPTAQLRSEAETDPAATVPSADAEYSEVPYRSATGFRLKEADVKFSQKRADIIMSRVAGGVEQKRYEGIVNLCFFSHPYQGRPSRAMDDGKVLVWINQKSLDECSEVRVMVNTAGNYTEDEIQRHITDDAYQACIERLHDLCQPGGLPATVAATGGAAVAPAPVTDPSLGGL